MVPLATFAPVRQAWQAADLARWADWWGAPFRFPEGFPLRTVTALRVALLEPAATLPMYEAAWAQNRNIGEPDVLQAVLEEAGFDGAALVAATADQAVKDRLRANTEAAQAAGVCGVPSFRMSDGSVLWGQDRLDDVAWVLAGGVT